jgi:predicted metal-binding protein
MQEKSQARAFGQATSPAQAAADLERLRGLAVELGASEAVVIPTSGIAVDARVRLKCTIPRCARAGETPNCPPHAPDLAVVRQALDRYSSAILFKCEVAPITDYVPGRGVTRAEQRQVLLFHKKGSDVIYGLERQAYKDGYHLAMGLGGGSCKDYLCQGMICQFLDSGRCRFPLRSRPSIEAMGIDVVKLIDHAGWAAYPLLDDLSVVPCAITVGLVLVC